MSWEQIAVRYRIGRRVECTSSVGHYVRMQLLALGYPREIWDGEITYSLARETLERCLPFTRARMNAPLFLAALKTAKNRKPSGIPMSQLKQEITLSYLP